MGHSKLITAAALGAAVALSGCSTTQTEFRKKPSSISMGTLCRTLLQSQDQNFQREIMVELQRRGIDPYGCHEVVQRQNQAAAALAVVALAGAAVAVCANGNCGGGYPQRSYRGNCQYNWQYDAAGNRCGNRSAAARPGGW